MDPMSLVWDQICTELKPNQTASFMVNLKKMKILQKISHKIIKNQNILEPSHLRYKIRTLTYYKLY